MQNFLKICIYTSKYAENMQKSKICKNKFFSFARVLKFIKFFKIFEGINNIENKKFFWKYLKVHWDCVVFKGFKGF